MIVEHDVSVQMRDGVLLASDVYRPDDSDRHPVLMQRTPYGKKHPVYLHGTTLDVLKAVADGYAVVTQDTRGRFASEGEWQPFRWEGDDGFDTVEWIGEQPWCNGKVGAYGTSYNGATSLHVAVANPRHLTTALSYMAGTSYDNGWVYTGGALELSFAVFWLTRGAWETMRRQDLPAPRREELEKLLHWVSAMPERVIRHLPVSAMPALAESELVPFWPDWLANAPGSDYWRSIDVPANASRIDVPVLHISGLYDNLLQGHLALNEALKRHSSEAVRDSHRFILGPWDHEAYQSSRPTVAGDYDFGPQAPNAYALMSSLAREWFDHWLLGAQTPLFDTPRSRYFRTGDDSWHAAETWPPRHQELALYLSSRGHANTRNGDGRLLADEPPSAREVADRFRYDPWNPVPSLGGRTLAPVFGTAGIHDQAAVEDRADVLVYSSEPLAEELVCAGPAALELFASSSCVDTDFTAKLVDVEPDGYCRNLADGIVRARYRDGSEHESFLEPGEITRFRIDLQAVSHVFGAGHRIRLEVSSSNFPTYDRNLNATAPAALGAAQDVAVALQTVIHDKRGRSRLLLPVVHGSDAA